MSLSIMMFRKLQHCWIKYKFKTYFLTYPIIYSTDFYTSCIGMCEITYLTYFSLPIIVDSKLQIEWKFLIMFQCPILFWMHSCHFCCLSYSA